MTKVVHIQYSVESAGGAALRLSKAFEKVGLDSTLVSLQMSLPPLPNVKYLGKIAQLIAKADSKIQSYLTRKIPKDYGLFSYPILGNNICNLQVVKDADIIYIHWALKGFLNVRNMKKLASLNKPVIIFMHDMWSISGGCHYSFDCKNYLTGCHNCQMFPSNSEKGLATSNFNTKKSFYNEYKNIYFITPSKWLFNCAKEALLTKNKPVFYIPNILDNTIFKPYDKNVAKAFLNIDSNDIVIAFGAVNVTNAYKGWSYLTQSLSIFKNQNKHKDVTILIFGSGHNQNIIDAIPFKIKFMGYLNDEYSTALVYNAADVFIAPSLAEAFGYVIFESLNCGTPVVGFDVGGIPDMIQHKQNGYLAKYKNAEDLTDGINYCLDNNLKGFVPDELNHNKTIEKHLELFNQIKSKSFTNK